MLAKFAEDDRIEQMNAQKRRMKQLEHKRAVEQLLEDRRAQYAAERVCILIPVSMLYVLEVSATILSNIIERNQ